MPNSNQFFAASYDNTVILQRNAQQQERIYQHIVDSQLSADQRAARERAKQEEQLQRELARAKESGMKKEVKDTQAKLQSLYAADIAYEQKLSQARIQAAAIATTYEENQYKTLNKTKRDEYDATVKAQLEADREALAQREQFLNQQIAIETDAAQKQKLKATLSDVSAQKAERDQQIMSIDKRSNVSKTSAIEDMKIAKQQLKDAKQRKKLAKEEVKNSAEYRKAKRKGDVLEMQNLMKTAKYKQAEEDEEAARHKMRMAQIREVADVTKQNLKNVAGALPKLMNTAMNSIEGNLDAMFGQQGRMMGRLQGSAYDWSDTVEEVSDTIGFSGVVSKKSVVNRMVELVDSGVAYNLEMRAFLAETSQNIASTFDATNGTLLRLIRLQQADTTAARLGMEASLTKLFNNYFNDTSYLAHDVSQTVTDALLEATSSMTRDQSLEFEYIMQKWLGSLYSLGASSDVISSIASGINYLGTGNVSALSGNTSLQTLLTMAAARSGGKTYSDMLLGGINADDTNKLMKSIIEMLAEISSNQTNNVTKSAYAELFGMSITDLSSFASLTQTEIQQLYQNTQSYSSMINETSNQLSQISKRMNISQLVDIAVDNALTGAAAEIGNDAFRYGTWKALGILQEYVGEIKTPAISVYGTTIVPELELLSLAKQGITSWGLLGSLMGAVGSMMNGGATNLANWNFEEFTKRGSTLDLLQQGIQESTSYSATLGVGSASGDDVSAVTMNSGASSATENASTSSEELQESSDIPKNIYEAIAGDSSLTVLSLLENIDEKLDPSRVFYTAIAGTLSSAAVEKVTSLSAQLQAAGYTPIQNIDTTKSADVAPTAPTTVTQSVSGVAAGTDMQNPEVLSALIGEAVQQALLTVLSQYTTGNGIPVTIANGGLYL